MAGMQVSFVGQTEEAARETAQKGGFADKVAVVKTSFKANSKVGIAMEIVRSLKVKGKSGWQRMHLGMYWSLATTCSNAGSCREGRGGDG